MAKKKPSYGRVKRATPGQGKDPFSEVRTKAPAAVSPRVEPADKSKGQGAVRVPRSDIAAVRG